MIRRHRAANIAAASGDECIVLLNELVLVYVADEFLMEDAEERWTCRWEFSVFLRHRQSTRATTVFFTHRDEAARCFSDPHPCSHLPFFDFIIVLFRSPVPPFSPCG